jgi:hypothetical protein
MVIPKAGLARGTGGGASPRYFYFSDSTRGLVVSGWFEPAQAFKGVEAFWSEETASWKRGGLPPPKNVETRSSGEWQTIGYDMDLPSGSNSHLRAHLVRAGTWIDVHLSATADRPESELHSELDAILASISVSERP